MDNGQIMTLAASAAAVLTSIVSYIKVRPEARKLDADAGTQIGGFGMAMAEKDRERLDKLQTAFDNMRHREIARDLKLIRHSSWDHRMIDKLRSALPDVEIEDPPPLFLPTTG